MSFVWRGGGILTIIILFSAALIAHSFYPNNRLALAAAFFIGALVNWIIGIALNRQLRYAGVAPLNILGAHGVVVSCISGGSGNGSWSSASQWAHRDTFYCYVLVCAAIG